jgi:hypothetical protein
MIEKGTHSTIFVVADLASPLCLTIVGELTLGVSLEIRKGDLHRLEPEIPPALFSLV